MNLFEKHTLVAHNDFNHISPRILTMCICPQDTNFQIPVSITVANKSISHPADKPPRPVGSHCRCSGNRHR